MLILFCNTGILSTGFSVFQPYLISDGGLTNAQASTIVTVRNLFALISMFLVAEYYRRLGYRLGLMLAGLIGTLSFVVYGLAWNFLSYSVAAALAGTSFGIGGMIPVSIVIHNWFKVRGGLALGLCTMGSGMSAIICPLLFGKMIERIGMDKTFYTGAVFLVVAAFVEFLIIRGYPRDLDLKPLGQIEKLSAGVKYSNKRITPLPKIYYTMAVAASLFVGAAINPQVSHLSVLYSSTGISAEGVSMLMALEGTALSIGKCSYGQVVDKIGAYKAGCIYFSFLMVGSILSCLAGIQSMPVAMGAMIFLGLGLSVSTVGFPAIAADISAPEQYDAMVKRFQISSTAGALLLNSVPGFIADKTGNYVAAFILLAVLVVIGTLLILIVYQKFNSCRKIEARKSFHRASICETN